MASSKKQFTTMHEQAVQLLRNFKQANDRINKSIGIEDDNSIKLKIKSQEKSHKSIIEKLDKILEKLDQSYLDPDTARKIGIIKQQYKIQKDRRQNLILSLRDQMKDNNSRNENIDSENYIKYTLANIHNKDPQPHYNRNKRGGNDYAKYSSYQNDQSLSTTTANTAHTIYQQPVTEYDYQIECKMITQRNNQIHQAQTKFMNIYNISKQTQKMVYQQGQQLDIITDELIKANRNVVYSVKELKQANDYQKSTRGRIVKLSILMILAAILVVGILLV